MADLIPDPPTDACANCAAPLASAFCAACGQKRVTRRLRVRDILREVWDKVADIENGFLHTCWLAVIAPHRIVVDWLSGRRRPYTPPTRFLIVVLTVEFFVQAWLMRNWPLDVVGRQSFEKMNRLMEQAHLGAGDSAASLTRFQWVVTLTLLPFLALGTWIAFRPWKRSYAEHLAGATYIQAGWALICIPLITVETVTGLRDGWGIHPVTTVLMPFWYMAAITRSFPGGQLSDRIGRTLGAGIVAFAAFSVPTCIGVVVLTVSKVVQGVILNSGR